VIQLLYKNEASSIVWETLLKEYLIIKENDEVMEAEIKRLIFDSFNSIKLIALLNC
jgi:hypothetical protein